MTREEIASILKSIRLNSGLTQKEAAEKIGRKQQTLASWETGQSQPDANTLFVLCEVYGTTVDRAFGFSSIPQNEISSIDKKILERYHALDEHGKEMVDFTLEKEYERASIEKEVKEEGNIIPFPKKQIQYYPRLASAGTGQIVFNGLPMDYVEIEDKPEYRNVKFAIGVNGSSMEPVLRDGDTLLVEPTHEIEQGQTGIFLIDGESFVKRLGNGVLESENPDYEDIPITGDTTCLGRVVDRLQSYKSRIDEMFNRNAYGSDTEFKRLLGSYVAEKEAEYMPRRKLDGGKK